MTAQERLKDATFAGHQPLIPKRDFSKTPEEREMLRDYKASYKNRMRRKHGSNWRKHYN